MLNTFESHNELDEVKDICNELRSLKQRIDQGDYSNPFMELKKCERLFDIIKNRAIDDEDEGLANAQMIYKHYFIFFALFANYHLNLSQKKYRHSWDVLQDCFDEAKIVGKFVDIKDRRELLEIVDCLLQYEKLYPYNMFFSNEYIVSKSHCSICGKSMLSLACPHRKGNLYWGDFATEVIEEIKELQAVCLVKNPDDKRCVAELSEYKDVPEEKVFSKLDEFLKLKIDPLRCFEITTKIERRRNHEIKKVNRNDLCPCGSGLKFKKCCINKMYYDHEKILVSPLRRIRLMK